MFDRIENTTLREHIRQDGIELYRRQADASSSRLNVPARHLRTLVSLVQDHFPGVEVWAYGSRLNGCGHDGSDLNLVLREPGLGEISSDKVGDFEIAVRESGIPFLVEVRDWAKLEKGFCSEVERAHVVVLGASIGNQPRSQWPTAAIADISERVAIGPFGSSIKVETFVSNGVPIISGQHLHGTRVDDSPGHNFITEDHAERLSKSNVQRGDIVLTHRGNIGQVAYVPG